MDGMAGHPSDFRQRSVKYDVRGMREFLSQEWGEREVTTYACLVLMFATSFVNVVNKQRHDTLTRALRRNATLPKKRVLTD